MARGELKPDDGGRRGLSDEQHVRELLRGMVAAGFCSREIDPATLSRDELVRYYGEAISTARRQDYQRTRYARRQEPVSDYSGDSGDLGANL